jgi:hypothetical protein
LNKLKSIDLPYGHGHGVISEKRIGLQLKHNGKGDPPPPQSLNSMSSINSSIYRNRLNQGRGDNSIKSVVSGKSVDRRKSEYFEKSKIPPMADTIRSHDASGRNRDGSRSKSKNKYPDSYSREPRETHPFPRKISKTPR